MRLRWYFAAICCLGCGCFGLVCSKFASGFAGLLLVCVVGGLSLRLIALFAFFSWWYFVDDCDCCLILVLDWWFEFIVFVV